MARKINIGELSVVLGANERDLLRGLNRSSAAMMRFSGQVQAVGKKMHAFGKRMTMAVTLPLLAIGAVAVKSFADFDKAMIESLAIMGDVNKTMRDEMAATAKQLSTETTFAAKELAGAYFFLASAGLDAAASMAALEPVAKFAQAGAFDLAVATDLLTDAQSALGLTIRNDSIKNMQNMIKLSDILVKGNTLANATVRQFSEALTNDAAPAMRQFKIEAEEGVAVLAALADQGIKGQNAGSMFGRGIRLLTKATLKEEAAFKKLDVTIFDAEGNFRNMADIMFDFEKTMGNMSVKQRAITLQMLGFQARTQKAILPLIGMSSEIRRYEKELRKAGGTTEEVARKQLEAFSNQMKILRNRLVNALATLGEDMIPLIKEFAGKLEELITKFQNLSKEQKKNILKWGGIALVAGPILSMVGLMTLGIGSLAKAIVFLNKSLLTLSAKGFLKFLSFAATPAGAMLLGIGATAIVAVGVVKAIQEFNKMRDAQKGMADSKLANTELDAKTQRKFGVTGPLALRELRRNKQALEEERKSAELKKEMARLDKQAKLEESKFVPGTQLTEKQIADIDKRLRLAGTGSSERDLMKDKIRKEIAESKLQDELKKEVLGETASAFRPARFTGALEKGTAAAFSAEVAERRDKPIKKVEKNTKDQVVQQKTSNSLLKEIKQLLSFNPETDAFEIPA